ncbi:MAG: efflux RND transporter periplasmic adaptor subunit [Gammaproteobacteria bacterium]|jgi:RND family efflux transporter MFP subunit|nr:efflux RND transporter periplasmic adaptor subunit [Gammaproteobacteria bacterium]MBT5826670.1 efflux RND transporter periplasmic adaptor subunit [Gammaproteobacteria bacterium]MBT5966147.1 efflux RND transporter periplasmic adaptor subunit [Gammaproteobacteria bacterium]MBT6420735.1 efflux RND transporter periplasmic adaptor subunit [Gammaproteobacteria bacterium]MBT6577033.1 efflux RND transporter periplasmic adaptor subunit [Gammaproteobacteria bacterium]
MSLSQHRWFCQSLIGLLALLLVACESKNEYIAPPAPEVTVSEPIQKNVTEYLEFTGTTRSVGFAEVKARVSGILQSMHFAPGVKVKQGDLLFIIDPEPYQAELEAAQAELVSAKAELNRAQAELNRADQLIKKNYISKTDYLRRKTERDVAQASIGLKAARVHSAEIQLGYTEVTAPIAGRVGRNMVDIGNLVGEGNATLLTTITQYKPMYVYFHLNERDLLSLMTLRGKESKQAGHNSDLMSDQELDIPLLLGLADEDGYPHEGVLDFGESSINTSTGTIELRGVFSNSEKPPRLLPGLFTRLRLPIGATPNALLVNERAIAADQSGRYVLVVNNENKVEKRPVTLGQHLNGMVVIEKGVKVDDKVIIKGLQKARPGSVVSPQTDSKAG